MSPFSSKRTPPPVISTDEVASLRFVDQLYPVSFDFSLVFRDVMDAEVLRAAAEKLLQRDGWRQLGARLRRNKSGNLEYHLPAEFTKERPLLLFTTDDNRNTSIDDHPVLRHIPKPNGDRPSIYAPAATSFRQYMRSPSTPESLDDWLYNDIPQLAIHVATYKDGTIITVTILHTLSDMMGLLAFYQAWIAALWCRDDQIAPFIGCFDRENDALENLHREQKEQTSEPYMFSTKLIKGWQFFKFAIRRIIDRFCNPKASLRVLTIPSTFVDKLATLARKELAQIKMVEKIFVSDSDVLCSWWNRLILQSQGVSPNRTVCLINNFCSRDILAKMGLLPSNNVAYLGNAAYPAPCFIPASKFLNTGYSLGLLANHVRDSIQMHRTEEQLVALDGCFRETKAKTGRLPLFGDSNMILCLFTNCYRGKLFEMDFSPAIISSEAVHSDDKPTKGRPVFINATGMDSPWASRNTSAVLGKDKNGQWWMSSRLRDDVWDKVEKYFDTL